MEQVAHRVNEHLTWLSPPIGNGERFSIFDDLPIPNHTLIFLTRQTGVLGHV